MKKNFTRILALILAVVMLLLMLASCGGKEKEKESPSPTPEEPTNTPTPTPEPVYITEYIGTVTNVSSHLNVRSGPSTNDSKIGEAKAGDKYTVLEQNVDGSAWHKISFNGGEGYVSGDYLTIEAIQVEMPAG